MSILAEPRRKQRISIDPQNLGWKNDEQKLSKKLMESMGWSEGDGLGKNRQGSKDNIKLKANYSGKGLGGDKLNDYDSTWISHHDDFADLLAALNKDKEQEAPQDEEEKERNAEKLSIELKSRSMKRRIHYQKFTRAKDTTNFSSNDRAAILGVGLTKKKKDEEEEKEEVKTEKVDSKLTEDGTRKEGINTVSTLSVSDYFAAKMAALKAKKATQEEVEVKTEIKEEIKEEPLSEDEEAKKKREKKERKRLRREQRQLEENAEVKVEIKEELPEEVDEEEQRRLRKERKRAKKLERQRLEQEQAEVEEPEPKKKRKIE